MAESMDSVKRHIIIHNAMGLVNAGWPLQEALEIALDQNQPLFSKRLKIRKTGGGMHSAGPGGGRGGQYGGGTEGVVTGG